MTGPPGASTPHHTVQSVAHQHEQPNLRSTLLPHKGIKHFSSGFGDLANGTTGAKRGTRWRGSDYPPSARTSCTAERSEAQFVAEPPQRDFCSFVTGGSAGGSSAELSGSGGGVVGAAEERSMEAQSVRVGSPTVTGMSRSKKRWERRKLKTAKEKEEKESADY